MRELDNSMGGGLDGSMRRELDNSMLEGWMKERLEGRMVDGWRA